MKHEHGKYMRHQHTKKKKNVTYFDLTFRHTQKKVRFIPMKKVQDAHTGHKD